MAKPRIELAESIHQYNHINITLLHHQPLSTPPKFHTYIHAQTSFFSSSKQNLKAAIRFHSISYFNLSDFETPQTTGRPPQCRPNAKSHPSLHTCMKTHSHSHPPTHSFEGKKKANAKCPPADTRVFFSPRKNKNGSVRNARKSHAKPR